MKIAGTTLIILAWLVGILTITLPLAVLFGSDWPSILIGEPVTKLPQLWAAYKGLIIGGIIIFAILHITGNLLRDKAKKREQDRD